jgi:phosphate acetyltransferase
MKLTGGYEAIGPIIVGLNKPINDLSRGCNKDEIYNLSLITMNMFINKEAK